MVAEHTRAVADVPARVEQIRAAATQWSRFWDGRLDLDALAWDVSEHLSDYHQALERVASATVQANTFLGSSTVVLHEGSSRPRR